MKQINLCLINKHFNVPFEGARRTVETSRCWMPTKRKAVKRKNQKLCYKQKFFAYAIHLWLETKKTRKEVVKM